MQVKLSEGDRNFAVLSLVRVIDLLFRYTLLSFLLAVNYSNIEVSQQLVQLARVWLLCWHVWCIVQVNPCGRCLQRRLVSSSFESVR